MKGNPHKKLTFEERDEKRHIRSYLNGYRLIKIQNRRRFRRKMKSALINAAREKSDE